MTQGSNRPTHRPLSPVERLAPVARSAGTGATRVRGRATSVLRPSGPPTMPISVRGSVDRVSEWHTRAVIDFCLRLGEAMLVTGASVADTTAALLRVCRAYGLHGVHVDITYTSVTISMHRGVHVDPITVMRIVTHFGTDYSRLEALHTLVREIAADRDDPGDIEDNLGELEHILLRPNLYRRAVVTFAWGVMGAGVALYLGAGILMTLISALSIMAVDRVQLRMAKRGVAAFFGQVIGAMVAASVAVVLLVARNAFPHVEWLSTIKPGIVVASSIVVLLAGMSVVNAAQDTLDGFYLTAGARTYEVLLLTGGVVMGSLLMLGLARRMDVTLRVYTDGQSQNILVVVAAAALMSGAYALSAYCGARSVAVAAVAGGTAGLIHDLVTTIFRPDPSVAAGTAAFAIGAAAPWVSRRLHVPSISLTAAGIMPLLPGLAVYKAIIFAVRGENGQAVPLTMSVILIALGLSIGVSLGTLLGRQMMSGADSLTAKVVGRTVQRVSD